MKKGRHNQSETRPEISVAVVGDAWLKTSSGEQQADFSKKSVRRMFEAFAITMEHAEDIESLNR